MEYPEEAGYPIGGDFPVKYYMIQIHYDNPYGASGLMIFCKLTKTQRNQNWCLDRYDSSGIRFYVGEKLRRYDLGYLTVGTESHPGAFIIPPRVDLFQVNAFCTDNATEVELTIILK